MEKKFLAEVETDEYYHVEIKQLSKSEYISKDKIRKLLQRYDKGIAWANADDHYYFVKFIKELLEEE